MGPSQQDGPFPMPIIAPCGSGSNIGPEFPYLPGNAQNLGVDGSGTGCSPTLVGILVLSWSPSRIPTPFTSSFSWSKSSTLFVGPKFRPVCLTALSAMPDASASSQPLVRPFSLLDLRRLICMHVFGRAGATGHHGDTHHQQATFPHTDISQSANRCEEGHKRMEL